MSDFNAKADVYRTVMKAPTGYRFNPPPQPVYAGTVADCAKYVLSKQDDYPETYSLKVPLEAGFNSDEFHYRDIVALSERRDFPLSYASPDRHCSGW
jgi:hypothetical protein